MCLRMPPTRRKRVQGREAPRYFCFGRRLGSGFDSAGGGRERELNELTNMVHLADLPAMTSGHGNFPGHPVNPRAALQLDTRLGVFFSPHENRLNGFFSEMPTKWSAAQTIWST